MKNNSQQPGEFANIQGGGGCTRVDTLGFEVSGVTPKKPPVDT